MTNTNQFFKDALNILTLFNSFRNAYNEQRLRHATPYHNATHAQNVIEALVSIGYTSPTVLLAAAYHDLVYFPMAGSDANERCSAALLGMFARDLNKQSPFSEYEKKVVNFAQEYIKNTSLEVHVQRDWEMNISAPDEFNALLDADLSSLAADWDIFLTNQENIILENGGELTRENYRKSAIFLQIFVGHQRKYIYRTSAGREMWETKANKNIEEYCKMV
jgi:predicted metal-dependent HD superfamily phosphohydrolase